MSNLIETVRVNLAERSYDIQIGAGNLAEAGRFLTDRAKVTYVVLVTDDHVQKSAMHRREPGEQDIEVDVIHRAGRGERRSTWLPACGRVA